MIIGVGIWEVPFEVGTDKKTQKKIMKSFLNYYWEIEMESDNFFDEGVTKALIHEIAETKCYGILLY